MGARGRGVIAFLRVQGKRRVLLRASVFLTGMSVLVVEIAATRMLAPYFGNTIYAVSSVLSVILAALAWGYRTGGRRADRNPKPAAFYRIVLIAGALTALSYALSVFLLPILAQVASLMWGPLIAALVFFLVPNIYLGMLSPFAVALEKAEMPQEGVGSASGDIFFYSTLGSIIGGILTGFVLVPHLGLSAIMIGTAALLCFLGVLGMFVVGGSSRDSYVLPLFFFLASVAAALLGERATASENPAVYRAEGTYAHIEIRDTTQAGRPVRLNMLDNEYSGAMYLDSTDADDHVFSYTPYYKLYTLFREQPPDRALVIGGAASYTVPKALLAREPELEVSVAEIDPRLPELARTYFGVPESSRLRSFTRDARVLLRESTVRYDVIFADAFSSYYGMPPHLATQEFFTIARDRLAPGGVFMMNIIGDLEPRERNLIYALMRTFRSVFPDADFFAVEDSHSTETQNFIFLGVKDATVTRNEAYEKARTSSDALLSSLEAHRVPVPDTFLSLYPILTDAYAPVEYLVSPSFIKQG